MLNEDKFYRPKSKVFLIFWALNIMVLFICASFISVEILLIVMLLCFSYMIYNAYFVTKVYETKKKLDEEEKINKEWDNNMGGGVKC